MAFRKKRLLAIFLAAMMVIQLCPAVSFASENADDAVTVQTETVEKEEAEDAETVEETKEEEAEPAAEEKQEEAEPSAEEEAKAEEEAEPAAEEETKAEEKAEPAAEEESEPAAEEESESAAKEKTGQQPAEEESGATQQPAEEAATAASTEQPAEEVFTAGELVFHGHDYDVTLEYDEAAKISANAELKVKEIVKGSSEYESYLKGAEAAVDKGVAEARFFDITIWADGKEVQPESPVKVNISYKEAIEVAEEGEVQAMHFKDGPKKPEVIDSDTNSGSEVDEIKFEADSFSVYGVIYTVDFTYDGYTFSMPGEGTILLSELAKKLNLYEKDLDKSFSVKNVKDVSFTDYDLVKLEKQADGDWLLTSLAPFTSEETLTITMTDGVKFVVVVTDPPEESGGTQISSDLTNFLTSVLITGATQNSEGRYEVEQGKNYSLIAKFEESADYQFQNDANLRYQMPEGIKIINEQTGPLKINIVYKGKTYEVDANFVLTTDGVLTIKFDESDPDYPKLVSSTNVSFRFTYNAEFDGSATEIHFSDDVERDIVFSEPEPGQAFAAKSAVFDESTGTFNYTIKVSATGDVTNVNVKDVISGDALIFNSDVQVSGNSSSYTDNGAANGFDYTFASMREGEEITITYSAKVNFAKDTDKDGKISADQTKNTVTVKPEEGEPHSSEYSREITFKTTSKSNGTEDGTTADGNKIITWTIDYNPLALASAAGDTIKDTIAADSAEYMKYYGDGITVEVYDHSGSNVRTDHVFYANMTSHSDSSWTYTIPAGDTEPYHYVITYQTEVDMEKVDGAGSAVHLTNTANGKQGAVDVTPGNQVGITKQVEKSSTEEISWVSEIHVPDGGLNVAVVTDTLPTIWSGNIGKSGNYSLYDLLKGDVEITGLVGDESYILDTSSEDKVVITFYKDRNRAIPGLTAVEGGHTITVRLTTTVNQEWLEAGYDYPTSYQSYHQNKIDINGTVATAGVRFLEEDMAKTASALGNGVFKYTIKLSNVSEAPIIIDDVFDTNLLEVDLSKESADWNKEVFYITGGADVDHIYSGDKSVKVNYSETAGGIRITANTVPMQEDGQYYPAYMITYFLKLKDGVDLEQLAIANGGTHELTNTANWNGHESSYTYETVYDYLDKKLLNEGELGDTNRDARYQITFNSSKAVLNGGEPMEMTDTLSANLSVDYSSVTIVTDPAGASVPYTFEGGDGGTTVATYTVPDATKVTITYSAKVTGNGSQKIVNKVKVKNQEETVESTKDYGAAGEGEGAIVAFKIVKVDGYDASKKLSGVKFKFYPSRSDIYFDDDRTIHELIYTTDENGEILIDGQAKIGDNKEIRLYFDQLYYLEEIEGPDDYGKISFPYNITLTNDMSKVDYTAGHWVYYYDDTMQIKNWPLEGLVVEKQVESSEEADLERYYSFRISILDENGSVDTSINGKIGDDEFTAGVTEFELKNGEQKMFWGFDKGTKYKVEEIGAEGFATSVTYSVYDEDGNVTEVKTENTTEHSGELTQEDETIIFKNKKTSNGSLKLKKLVTVNGEATTGTLADGDYTFTIKGPSGAAAADQVTKTVVITVTGGAAVSATVDGVSATLDADKYVEVTDLEAGEYTITETAPTNGTSLVGDNGKKVTVEAGKVGDAAPVAEFKNDYETVSAQVKKVWEGGNNLPSSLSVKLYADDDATDHTVTLTADNGWTSEVISGLPKYKTAADGTLALDEQGNPVAIGYHWVEGSMPSGFFLTNAVESDITNGTLTTLTNTYQEFSLTTSYIGTKTWKGASKPDNLTVKLYANGVETSHTPEWTNKNTNVWTYEFKNLPVFDTDGNVIKYTAAETLTGPYSQVTSETTSEETTYVQGTPDSTSVKPCDDIDITLNAHTDLGYAVIKLTGNEGFVIWTHRVPTSSELAQINSEAAKEFHDFDHKSKRYYNGVGHIDTPVGTIDVSFAEETKKLDIHFGGSSTWAWLVYGNFADAQYNPGTTNFVNKFEDTFVEVDKQWLNPDGTTANWPEDVSVTIKLTADGTEVAGKTAVLDADHTSYKFENLPKYHENGTTQINYSVEEVQLTGYTSTVSELTDERTITITNQKETVKATLEATKDFNDWGKADSFTFELKPVGNAPMPEGTVDGVKTATATQQQVMASFGEITYEAAGTYEYTIKEVDDGIPGITYDTSSHRVVVKVTKVGTSEKLTADVKYDSAASLTIINKYASAKAALQATKDFNDWGKADSFTFELKPVGNAPMPAGTSDGKKTATATSTNKTAAFGEIEYKEAGTYQYTITEVNDGEDGVSYDTTDHSVVVVVTKEGDNLVADVKYDGKASLTITNTYTSVKKSIEVTKGFKDWGKATEFKFDLKAVTEGAPMPEGTVDGVKTATATEGAPLAVFGDIEFEKAGTYEYTITEQNGGADGVTYDTEPHSVTVTVSKAEDATNALTAEVKYGDSDSLTITNTFTAVEEELEATKAFNAWGKATSFTFDLAAVSAETPDGRTISPVPVPASMTATATEDEPTASFGPIKYEKAGTYTYTITERNGGADGVSYDTVSHTAVVTVSKDPETNALSTSVKYDDKDSLTVTNTYTSTKAEIEATKDFNDWGKATEFKFDLAAVTEGAPMPEGTVDGVKTAAATEDAPLASFGEITYEKAGVYEYTITEQNGGADGVTYDTNPHKVVVTVTKAEDATNKLTAEVKYDGADSLTITNTYTSVKKELEATKQINDWGTAESFTFTLKAKGGAPMPADAEDGAKSVDVTKDSPLAKFGEIEYEAAGTYEYTIKEEQGDADGVTYDTTEHTAVVTVAKDPATNALSATVKYDDADALTITNKYASANIELQATKQFDDWGKADSFTFTLKPVSTDAPMPDGTSEEGEKTATATSAATTANFGSITYKKAGTYEYTITETDDGKDGVTYDTTPHKVVVTVDKDASNKLVAEAKYDDEDSLIITNTYEAAKATLEATKSFADWGKADSFTFNLEAVDGAPMPAGTTDGKKSGIATQNAPVVDFGEITFEKAGTYKYTITEQNGGADGVTYDTTPHNVVVTVTKGEGNKLSAEVKYDDKDSLIVTNTYAATEAELKATKEFNDWGKADSFTFKLEAVTDGAPMPEETTAEATEDAPEATFENITFEKQGTYKYTITEINDGKDGVTYDTTPHNVTVTVTKAADATNALTAKVTYDDKDSLTITNTYEATSAELKATKEFNDWGKADSFTFNLAAVTEGAPMPAKTSATATGDAPEASFGNIKFEKAGTYEYTITEVNDGVDGVSYDTTAHKAVVTVSKAQGTNKLSATVKYDGKDSLIITNTFTATEATLEAAKNFNDWGKAESFTFDLAAVTEGAPMPENTEATAVKDNVNAVFGKVVYNKAGTYEYTITERNDGADGVTYDTTAHKVKVEVTKAEDATNALTAKVTYDEKDALIVTNTYEGTSATLQATKSFDNWGKADSFTFDLAAVTEGAPMPENKVATATESAKTAVFGSVEYEKTGKYEYTITERNDGVDGVTYDTKAHKVVVNVTKDADNKMTAKVTYDGDENLIITNTFTAAKAHFETTKEFNDWGKADSFTFDLAAVTEDAPMPAETSVTATKGKAAVFGDMEFDKAGTYEYTITEQNGGADGVSYDVTPHNATVVVTKDAETNELSAEVTYDGEKNLIITNTFTAAKAHAEATKVLEQRDWFNADEFEFEIAAVTEGAPMPKETTAKAAKDARTAVFGDMEFGKAGTYLYTITEIDGGIKGITYDTEPHNVTVTVSKAEDATNKLTAAVTYDGKDKLEITNKYASEGSIVLKAKKALNGRPLEDKQFTFELMDESGEVIQTVQNGSDGTVEFAPISYTQADITSWDAEKGTGTGSRKYTVKETIETKDGYSYDENVFDITVTLTDNGDATITTDADKKLEDLVFTNEYKAEGEIVLGARKVLDGKTIREDQFSFELKDAEGNVLQTRKNAADGSVTFDAIKYTQDDIYEKDAETGVYSGASTKTYNYTINEVIPEGATPSKSGGNTFEYKGYTFDATVYTVAVVLKDNGDGTITATTSPDAESLAFTNAYGAAGTLKLDAEKTFKNGTLKGDEFTFELKDADGKVLQSKKNDAAGNVSFDLITYKMEDLAKSPFKYTVSEVTGDKEDVKYDNTVYTVTVTLKDNDDGTLSVTKEIENPQSIFKAKELKFVNEQLNVNTSITLGGVKVLQGQTLKANQFKFVLTDENGKKISTARNDADGNFTFKEISYKLSDLNGEAERVYTYKVSEVKGSMSNVTYDTRVYTVKVTVTDNGDGTMTATADLDKKSIKFVNKTVTKKKTTSKKSGTKKSSGTKRKGAGTGDNSPLGLLFGGLAVGAAGIAALLWARKKRNKKS